METIFVVCIPCTKWLVSVICRVVVNWVKKHLLLKLEASRLGEELQVMQHIYFLSLKLFCLGSCVSQIRLFATCPQN